MTLAPLRARAEIDEETLYRFVFLSTFQGLMETGLEDAEVDRLLKRDEGSGWPVFFVYACPLCQPAYDALATYRHRPIPLGSKGGGRDWALIPDHDQRRHALREGTDEEAAAAWGSLVGDFIARGKRRARWTPAESQKWEARIRQASEEGKAQLKDYKASGLFYSPWMDECEVCRGARQGVRSRTAR